MTNSDHNKIGIDGIQIASGDWKKLEKINVFGVSIIFLFSLNPINWAINCYIDWDT